MKHWVSAVAVITLVLVSAHSAPAQDQDAITLIAPGIMQGPIEKLIPGFEAKTGHKVKATFGGEDTTKQQVIKGDAFDVPVLENTGKTLLDAVTRFGERGGQQCDAGRQDSCWRRGEKGRVQAGHFHA